MLRCKHVADALADHHYWELPWLKRVGLKLHVALCVVCGRYHRQIMRMQEMADGFRRREEADTLPGQGMPPETKARMKSSLSQKSR